MVTCTAQNILLINPQPGVSLIVNDELCSIFFLYLIRELKTGNEWPYEKFHTPSYPFPTPLDTYLSYQDHPHDNYE